MSVRLVTGLLCVLCLFAAVLHGGDGKRVDRKQSQRPASDAEPLSAEAEQRALHFVRAQHAELADLLDALQRSNRAAFQSALRDVSRDIERLARIAERDSERHRLSLLIWNLDSRIRLEIARLSMSSDAEVEARLRPMIEERQAARIALLEVDCQRQQERLEKLTAQLAETRTSAAQHVTAEIDRIQRIIAARSRSRTSAARPARTRDRKPLNPPNRSAGKKPSGGQKKPVGQQAPAAKQDPADSGDDAAGRRATRQSAKARKK